MTYFHNLRQIVDTLDADETTKKDPIKRTFVIQGRHLTGNVGVVSESGNAPHTQTKHDEVLVTIDGGVRFRVGDGVKTVRDGDSVFIPQGTLHGLELEHGQTFSALSVFAPLSDPSQNNIQWERDS